MKKPTKTEKPTKKPSINPTQQKERLIQKIAQQAKDAQIEKQAKKVEKKIPIGIRIFFGCSLLLFCIALYKTILFPKIIQSQPSNTLTADVSTVDVENPEMNEPYFPPDSSISDGTL